MGQPNGYDIYSYRLYSGDDSAHPYIKLLHADADVTAGTRGPMGAIELDLSWSLSGRANANNLL